MLSDEIQGYFTDMPGFVRVHNLSNKAELFKILADILIEAANRKKFLFHIVGHGNKDCLGFKHTGEKIKWSELTSVFFEINKATQDSLVLNMTTCLGLHGIKLIEFLPGEKAVFGLIGYSKSLPIPVARNANKIFYKYFKSGIPINNIVKKIQEETKDPKYLCISSQGYNYIKDLKNKGVK